jgi:hypothetical protein
MKKIYSFLLMLVASVVANATTLYGDPYLWDSTTSSAVKSDEQIAADVTISDGKITFNGFLGSELTVVATVNIDGTVTDNLENKTYSNVGTFSIGDLGDYSSVYFYSGYYSYDNFSYYVKDGQKTLQCGFYAYEGTAKDWYDVYFYLPDDFEPYNPYAGQKTADIKVNVYDGDAIDYTDTVTGYYQDGVLTLLGLFNTSTVSYTVKDNGKISTSLAVDWVESNSYSYNNVANSWLYWYGNKYLSYDAKTRTITDYVWFYTSNAGVYYTITLPEDFELQSTVQTLKADVWKWDDSANKSIEADEQVNVSARVNDGVVTLINFLGSGNDIEVSVYDDGSATHDKSNGTLAGTFTFGSFGDYEGIYLYAGNWGYDDFDYEEDEDGKYLNLGIYTGAAGRTDPWFDVTIYLPDDFEPLKAADPYEGLEKKTLVVKVLDSNSINVDFKEDVTAYLSDTQVTLVGLFKMTSDITYTIGSDGSISSSMSKGYVGSNNYEFNGVSNSWIYMYGNEYLTYTASTKTIQDYAYFYASNDGRYFQINLNEESAVSDITVDETSDAPVEYYNLQGVRVANPQGGLFIKRQGNKASKVIIK